MIVVSAPVSGIKTSVGREHIPAGAGAQCVDVGGGVAVPAALGSPGQKIQDPAAERSPFPMSRCGPNGILNAQQIHCDILSVWGRRQVDGSRNCIS